MRILLVENHNLPSAFRQDFYLFQMLARTLQRMFPFKNQSFKTMSCFQFEADVGKYAKNDVFMHHQKYEILKDINKKFYYFSSEKPSEPVKIKFADDDISETKQYFQKQSKISNSAQTKGTIIGVITTLISSTLIAWFTLYLERNSQKNKQSEAIQEIYQKSKKIKIDKDYQKTNDVNDLTELRKIFSDINSKKQILFITGNQGEGKSVAIKKVLLELQKSQKEVVYFNIEEDSIQQFIKKIKTVCSYLQKKNKDQIDRKKNENTFIVIDSFNKIISGQPQLQKKEVEALTQIVQLLHNKMCKTGYKVIFISEKRTFLEEYLQKIDGIERDKYKKIYISQMGEMKLKTYLKKIHQQQKGKGKDQGKEEKDKQITLSQKQKEKQNILKNSDLKDLPNNSPNTSIDMLSKKNLSDPVIKLIVENHSSLKHAKYIAKQYTGEDKDKKEWKKMTALQKDQRRAEKAQSMHNKIIKEQKQKIQSAIKFSLKQTKTSIWNTLSRRQAIEEILFKACFFYDPQQTFTFKSDKLKRRQKTLVDDEIDQAEEEKDLLNSLRNSLRTKNIIFGDQFQTLSFAKAMTLRFREKYQKNPAYKKFIDDQLSKLEKHEPQNSKKDISKMQCHFKRHDEFKAQVEDFTFVGVF